MGHHRSRTARARAAIVAAGALAVGGLDLAGAPDAIAVGDCPTTVDAARFASADELRAANQVMADLGPRPTGSDAHEAFIRYLEERVDAIDGLARSAIDDTIQRQLETDASLTLGGPTGPTDVPIAGPVPYSRPAPEGVTAPLVLVPTGTALAEASGVMGSIVVRPAPPGSVPFAVFTAVAYAVLHPGDQFDLLGSYERDWLGAGARITDLREAEAAGAAGVVFVQDLPRDQIEGQYAPYEGVAYDVPALYLGADEGAPLVQHLATGAALEATIRLDAERRAAPTRTVVATLPGQTAERIVVQSHTDGMNAVWDNGPIAMLALAEHLASLPLACRPRTIEFVFTTAHLHLSHSGAERYAAELDAEYDSGTVAFVAAIEHLGAREFAAVPRTDGPGRRLVPTGRPEMLASFVSESPVLALGLIDRINQRQLPFTLVLRGADAPQVRFPPHRSFGGEGGPYREHLIPTVAAISGPWTLFDPAFGLDELVDPELMRRQAMVFGDLILANSWVPREVLAGLDPVYRLGRELLGAEPLEALGLPPIDVTAIPGELLSSPLLEGVPLPVAQQTAVRTDDAVSAGTLSASWFCSLLGLG